jgi:hypothetical protein
MKLPGFNAEASVNQKSGHYNLYTTNKDIQSRRTIFPQARILDCFCLPSGKYCCCRGSDGKWVCAATISTFSPGLSPAS